MSRVLIVLLLVSIVTAYWVTRIHSRFNLRMTEGFGSCPSPSTDADTPLTPDIMGYNGDLEYTNLGEDAWKHHGVQGSLMVDPKVKYPNAYYYELDNTAFMNGLRKALVVPCTLVSEAISNDNWSPSKFPLESGVSPPNDVMDAYNSCVNTISSRLNGAASLKLPGDSPSKPSKIQIVHDILKSYKVHKTSTLLPMYLIDMELLFYRESKYQGKHVGLTCTVKKNMKGGWFTNVVAIHLLGVVPEDQIAMFPVTADNPFDIQQQTVNDAETPPTKQDASTIEAAVKQHALTYAALANTELSLASKPRLNA